MGERYTTNLHLTFGPAGLVSGAGTGNVAKFRLPDGSFWNAAGHVNLLNPLHMDPATQWGFLPDVGASPDRGRLCAALQ